MLNKFYEHCKSDIAATNNKEFRRALQYTVKCDICDMCCKILHSPFLIHRRLSSESESEYKLFFYDGIREAYETLVADFTPPPLVDIFC